MDKHILTGFALSALDQRKEGFGRCAIKQTKQVEPMIVFCLREYGRKEHDEVKTSNLSKFGRKLRTPKVK